MTCRYGFRLAVFIDFFQGVLNESDLRCSCIYVNTKANMHDRV